MGDRRRHLSSPGFKHAAIFMARGRFLSYGPTVHAEAAAVRKLGRMSTKRLRRVDLMVIRTSKTGVLGMSKPCAHCLYLLNRRLPSKGF